MKKMAILRLTPEALRDLLQLPDGCEVVRVELAPGYRGTLHLTIEGAGWDTPEGGLIVPTDAGTVTQIMVDGVPYRTIDWNLPKGE